jgi:type II secretory pathway pseudopilin PulG
MKSPQRRPAFMLTDTIIGLMIVGILGTVLVTAITTDGRAKRQLNDSAAALHIAQRVMATLREGKPAPQSLDDATVQVGPADGAAPATGKTWVRVAVNYHGRTATLIGLAPRGGQQ